MTTITTNLRWFLILLACPCLSPASGHGQEILLEVEAGKSDRIAAPVVFELPPSLKNAGALALTRMDGNGRVSIQRVPDCDSPQIAWIVRDLPAGQTRRYRLAEIDSSVATDGASRVTVDNDGRRLLVKAGGKPVLQYNSAVVEPPAEIPGLYRRSGFIHPIFDPEGRIMTDDFPPDHAHQHGVFFAWVSTTFQGRPVDFWNQVKAQGSIAHAKTGQIVSGPVFAQFSVELLHTDNTTSTGPVPVLRETWIVRVYNCTDAFLFDLESRQQCVAEDPLIINQYRYGGLALRAARPWFDPEGKNLKDDDPQTGTGAGFWTSEGKLRIDGNHTRPDWASAYGPINGRYSAITIMSHPSNFRHPQPVRLHPSKPYFCFAPMVLGEFRLNPGEPYISRYRFRIHTGRPSKEQNQQAWASYASPPQVRVIEQP